MKIVVLGLAAVMLIALWASVVSGVLSENLAVGLAYSLPMNAALLYTSRILWFAAR